MIEKKSTSASGVLSKIVTKDGPEIDDDFGNNKNCRQKDDNGFNCFHF
ncbi:hypothetical protein [Flagellimonas hymeniacidonis]|nr:hypothetical protein [Flagellimonas hymeniacidonis]